MNNRTIIYIPEDAEDIPFIHFPISNHLQNFLRIEKVKVVSDLKKLSPEILGEILYNKKKPFYELKKLIIAIQESNADEVILVEESSSEFENEIDIISDDDEIDKVIDEVEPLNKIYIPARTTEVLVEQLPISNFLKKFFDKHHIKLIRQLQIVNTEIINKIISSSEKPFPELRHYILAFQESENDEIILVSDTNAANPQEQDVDKSELRKRSRKFAAILSQKILFPLPARKWRISTLPLSQQLIGKLQMSGCGKLEDIHGIPYSRFSSLKAFEDNDVMELYSLITQLHSVTGFRSVEGKVSAADVEIKTDESQKTTLSATENIESNNDVFLSETNLSNQVKITTNFNAPETIQTLAALKDLPIAHLAPSNELEALLRKINIFFVGQLQEISYRELANTHNFDAENILELQTLLAFAKKSARYKVFPRDFGLIRRAAILRKEKESTKKKSFVGLHTPNQASGEQKQSVESDKIQTQNEQNGFSQSHTHSTQKFKLPTISTQKFVVPASLKETPINKFSLSIKLVGILNKLGIENVGDFEKISFNDFTKVPFCTKQAKAEFRQLIFQIQNGEAQSSKLPDKQIYIEPQTLNLSGVMDFINQFVSNLLSTDREILLERFGGLNDERVLTFERIANKHQIARERAYQIHLRTLTSLKNKLQHRAEDVLKKLNNDCLSAVCPLMPKFLVNLTNNEYELFQYPPAFYIRIFGVLLPELPVLPEIKNQNTTLRADAKKIEQEIKSFLENSPLPISLPEIFNRIMTYHTNKETAARDFFEVVQSAKFNLITTNNPNELFIELRGG